MKPAALFLAGAALWASACTASTPSVENDGERQAEEQVAAPNDSVTDLSGYVGKYPWDKVDGVDFLHHPAVQKSVKKAVADPELQELLLTETAKATTGLIVEAEGRLLMAAFDPASGGDVNWALLVAVDGSTAAVCYSTGVEEGEQGADWYHDGEKRFTLYVKCPHNAEDLLNLGTWPIGNIPG